jgi:cytochrome c
MRPEWTTNLSAGGMRRQICGARTQAHAGFSLAMHRRMRDNARAMGARPPSGDRPRTQETAMTQRTSRTLFGAAALAIAAAMTASAARAAEGNAENGKKLFHSTAQCKICHSVKPDQKMVGPSVFAVVGRKCGTAAKQAFSSNYKAACAKTGFAWDEASLDGYLTDPSAYISAISGKTMRSPMSRNTPKAEDRADIIAYLKTLK